MTVEDGVEFDCSSIYTVPPRATGAIIYVRVKAAKDSTIAFFRCSDSKGKFFPRLELSMLSSSIHNVVHTVRWFAILSVSRAQQKV
jgi:hypothetical protein